LDNLQRFFPLDVDFERLTGLCLIGLQLADFLDFSKKIYVPKCWEGYLLEQACLERNNNKFEIYSAAPKDQY
jgi:hypothetical protein